MILKNSKKNTVRKHSDSEKHIEGNLVILKKKNNFEADYAIEEHSDIQDRSDIDECSK